MSAAVSASTLLLCCVVHMTQGNTPTYVLDSNSTHVHTVHEPGTFYIQSDHYSPAKQKTYSGAEAETTYKKVKIECCWCCSVSSNASDATQWKDYVSLIGNDTNIRQTGPLNISATLCQGPVYIASFEKKSNQGWTGFRLNFVCADPLAVPTVVHEPPAPYLSPVPLARTADKERAKGGEHRDEESGGGGGTTMAMIIGGSVLGVIVLLGLVLVVVRKGRKDSKKKGQSKAEVDDSTGTLTGFFDHGSKTDMQTSEAAGTLHSLTICPDMRDDASHSTISTQDASHPKKENTTRDSSSKKKPKGCSKKIDSE